MSMPELSPHSPARRLIEGRGTTESTWLAAPVLHGMETGDVAEWAARFRRIWLIAPHPDDEVLALGGTLARLSGLHADLRIVSVTDGEASHRDSPSWTPDRLASARAAEMLNGLRRLGITAGVTRLGLPDGRVGAHRETLLRALVDVVDQGDLLLATCRFDGHPDHEACGEVAALAAELTGATLFEYPVWMWHWAHPDEALIPWNRAQSLPIGADLIERKRGALQEFVTQITPDGAHKAVLPPHVLPRFLRPFEIVFA